MTTEDFNKKYQEIEDEALSQKTILSREYAFANNKVKVNDIVTDHIGSIQVTRIKFVKGDIRNLPFCTYEGIELKKDLMPTKAYKARTVLQRSIINHIHST